MVYINNRFIPKKRLQSKITPKESKIEEYFVKALNESGIKHIKGNAIGVKGFPDRIVFADKIYFVEIKVGEVLGSYYKQTRKQKEWQDIIENSKGTYVLLKGHEVDNFIKELKKGVRD